MKTNTRKIHQNRKVVAIAIKSESKTSIRRNKDEKNSKRRMMITIRISSMHIIIKAFTRQRA